MATSALMRLACLTRRRSKMCEGRIARIHIIRNPDKLAHLSAMLNLATRSKAQRLLNGRPLTGIGTLPANVRLEGDL